MRRSERKKRENSETKYNSDVDWVVISHALLLRRRDVCMIIVMLIGVVN